MHAEVFDGKGTAICSLHWNATNKMDYWVDRRVDTW